MKKKVLLATLASFAIAGPLSAQQQNGDPDKERRVLDMVGQTLQQAPPAQGQPSPVTRPAPQAQTPPSAPAAPFRTPGPRVDLTIQDAVQRGLEKNIDIAVARITPRTWDFTIAASEANYRPNLTSAFSNSRNTQLPRQTTQGISAPTTSTTSSWSSGVGQNLWWGGGSYNVSWTNSRFNNPSSVNIRNPQFTSGLTASLVQPLIRGFKIDSTRAALMTNRISQTNDEISLESTMASTIASTRNAYWDLVFAIQAVDAAQSSLDLAGKLVQDNQSRVEIGTLAPIDVVSAQAEQANRRSTLVQAQATLRTAELALKRLIVGGTDDPLYASSINPVDRPPSTPEAIDVEGAVARALKQRTDLQQSVNNLKISDINLQNQVDLTKPSLNLSVNYGLNGLGGPFVQTGQTVASGYFDAIRNIVGFDAPVWTVGVNLAYPIGRSAAQANVARSKLSLEQSQAQIKSLQLQIATDVMNAALNVQSSLEVVQASGVARELSQKKLEAAQSKFEVGMATNYEVVQAQRDLADAQNSELRAILNYRKALVNFETVQTVSGSRGVSSAVGSGGGAATTTGGGGTGGGAGGTTGGGTTGGGTSGGGL